MPKLPWKRLLSAGLTGLVLGFGYYGLLNYKKQEYNYEIHSQNRHIISEVNSIFGFTQYTTDLSKETADIVREYWSPGILYTAVDYNQDGLADVYIVNCSYDAFCDDLMLHRDKDHSTHKEEFRNADELLAEVKERFKDRIK